MDLAKFLIEQYARDRNYQILTAAVQATELAAADNEVIAAPASGSRIVVLDLVVSPQAAMSVDWYHTTADAGNRLTGTLLLDVAPSRLAPMVLPPATPLIVVKTDNSILGGNVAYAVL